MANLELDKTLVVNEDTYNINAVNADHVANTLVIKKNLLTTIDMDEFDGSVQKEIDYVPASGGTFTGSIRVPNNTEIPINDKTVINFSDIKNTVLTEILNNTVLYEWTGESVLSSDENGLIKSVSVITGEAGNVNAFAVHNYKTKQFSAFIYIADNGLVYFGTADSDRVVAAAVSAESAINANQLTNARRFSVNLESSSTVNFNGTEDAALGVTGTLPIAKGGTDATTAAKAAENIIKGQKISPRQIEISTKDQTYANNSGYGMDLKNSDIINVNSIYFADPASAIESIRFKHNENSNNWDSIYASDGTLYFAPNASTTKADKFYKVYHAGNLAAVKTDLEYKKITISSNNPSGGVDGDIWIKY